MADICGHPPISSLTEDDQEGRAEDEGADDERADDEGADDKGADDEEARCDVDEGSKGPGRGVKCPNDVFHWTSREH